MAGSKLMKIVLPSSLARETKRAASAEATTPEKVIEAALRQYLNSSRWRRLRRWGAATAKHLGLKTEANLARFLTRSGRTRARRR